jgi:hypothetical protein
MNRFLTIIFCKLYGMCKWIHGNGPEYSAIGLLGLLLSFNLMTLYVYCRYLITRSAAFDLPVVGMPIVSLIMLAVCFMLFLRGDKYIKLYKEFSKSKVGSGHTATWITVAYVFVSILALFSKAWLH